MLRARSLVLALAMALPIAGCAPDDAQTPPEHPAAETSLADAEAAIDRAEAHPDADVEGLGITVAAADAALGAALDLGLLADDDELADALRARVASLHERLQRVRDAAVDDGPVAQAVRLPFDLQIDIEKQNHPTDVLFAAGPGESCLGKNETNDRFGEELALGDFDGDGYDDLAVGVPHEQDQLHYGVGMVYVYRGSASGFSPWFALTQEGLGTQEGGDRFGHALAAADFDGDGLDDLAVGTPNESIGDTQRAGYVYVFRGGADGLTPWHGVGQNGLGSTEAGDKFGYALAAGDFDADGRADLAVNAIDESTLGADHTGYVFVFRGTGTGLTKWHGLHHASLAAAQDGERFGWAMSIGDYNADGRDDLAVGSKGADDQRGAAWVFLAKPLVATIKPRSRAYGIRPLPLPYKLAVSQRLDQSGLGSNEVGDRFGETMTSGDFDGDGDDELVVGAPGEDSYGKTDNGHAFVFRSNGSGHMAPWRGLNVNGIVEVVSHHSFAWAMTAADFNGDGRDDLAVGRPSHSSGALRAGQLFLWRGTQSGLTNWGILDQSGLDPSEAGDQFSRAVVAGDINNDGHADLAVAAPWERIGDQNNTGSVYTFRGRTGTRLPAPLDAVAQQESGCQPTWPTPPAIDLVGVSHDRLEVRFSGDTTVTHLYTRRIGVSSSRTDATNELTRTFAGLAGSTEYCFYAMSLHPTSDAWSDPTTRCFTTDASPAPDPDPDPDPDPEPEEHSFTVWMNAQPIVEGNVPYLGSWGPVFGAKMTRFTVVDGGISPYVLRFLKPGRSTTECNNPSAVVEIADGATTTPAQMSAIFGTAEPTGKVYFLACKVGAYTPSVRVNIKYVYE